MLIVTVAYYRSPSPKGPADVGKGATNQAIVFLFYYGAQAVSALAELLTQVEVIMLRLHHVGVTLCK